VNENVPGVILGSPGHYPGSTLPIVNVSTGGVGVDTVYDPSEEFSLHAISAYRNDRGLYQTDTDRTSLSRSALRLVQRQQTFSQEFDFTGREFGALNWLGGLYYYWSDAGNPYFSSYSGDAVGSPTASFTDTVHTNSYAAFGELTYDVTSQLHLTAGGRYTWEKKALDFADTIRAAGLRTAQASDTWTSPTYRAVVRYDITSEFNVYGSASDGFKSGVFNAYALPAIPVQPEKIMAYEVGSKARVGGITLTAAAFDYDYRDIQVQGQTFFGSSWVVTLENAAHASIKGYELSANGDIAPNLSFDIGISALPTSRYSDFPLAQVFVPNGITGGATNVIPYDASGSRVIRSPKWQGNLRLMYSNTVFGGRLVASAAASYNSGFYWQPGNFTPEGAYAVVNARIGWTEPKGIVTYSLWGENLTNRLYSFNSTSGLVGLTDAFAPPRLIGLGVNVKF
jgi:iron complex outermembrane receptor protein